MDLFETKPELTRHQKLLKSKQHTAELTKWAIDFLNNSGQFQVNRSNNFPSPRITRGKATFKYFSILGNVETKTDHWAEITFEYDDVDIHFKKGNIKETILDISGFVLPYNGNDKWVSKHIELEVKTGKDSLSDGQIKRISDINKSGGISFHFSNKETFLLQIKKFMVERKLAF